ncbi:MAG: integral membrane rhomboid family serine protease MJ0610.1, partial [uncultured Rubrobacteraceae bacterium]
EDPRRRGPDPGPRGRRAGLAPGLQRLPPLRVLAPRPEHALPLLSRLLCRERLRAGAFPRALRAKRALRRDRVPLLRRVRHPGCRGFGRHLRAARGHPGVRVAEGIVLVAEPRDPAAPDPAGHKPLHRPLHPERQQHGPHGRPRRGLRLRLPRRPHGLQPQGRPRPHAHPDRARNRGAAARDVDSGLQVL